MQVVVVNNTNKHVDEIALLFSPQDQFTYISYEQFITYPLADIECLVLMGESTHPHYAKKLAQEISFLQQLTMPTIGICLGCELLVEAYGGIMEKKNERKEGVIDIFLKDDSRPYIVSGAHRYTIAELSSSLQGLAKSEYGYEIVQHVSKQCIAFQFHPEYMQDSKDGYHLFMQYAGPLVTKPKIFIHHNDGFDDGNHYAFMSHRVSNNTGEHS